MGQFVYDIASSYDAFGRLRVSEPYTIFNSKLLYDNQPTFWHDLQISGSNTTSTFNSNEAAVTLSVSSNIAGAHVRQTYQRFAYQPGKSQLVMMTGIIGSYSNDIIRRIGVFDCNNGLFFQSGPDDYYIVKRSSVTGTPVDLAIPQAQWNKNKLDSQSLIQVDFNKGNLFYFNYEWLGIGDICCGLIIGKKYIQLHQFFIGNESYSVSFSKPNLPLRYEISNLGRGPAASMKCVCSTIISEGGQGGLGNSYSIDRYTTKLSISVSNLLYCAIAIRLKNGFESGNIFLENINIVSPTQNVLFYWGVFINPIFSGGDLTYTSKPSSCLEYNITNTTVTMTDGIPLRSGYGIGTNSTLTADLLSATFSIGTSITGVSDVLVLAIQRIDNQTNDFYASITVREVL